MALARRSTQAAAKKAPPWTSFMDRMYLDGGLPETSYTPGAEATSSPFDAVSASHVPATTTTTTRRPRAPPPPPPRSSPDSELALALWARYRTTPELIRRERHWALLRAAASRIPAPTDRHALTLRAALRAAAEESPPPPPPPLREGHAARSGAGPAAFPEHVVRRCAWVVAGASSDERLRRFLSAEAGRLRQPFLLLQLLHPLEAFADADGLQRLLGHVGKYYVGGRADPGGQEPPPCFVPAADFEVLVQRLVYQCARTLPRGYLGVARLVKTWLANSAEGLAAASDGPLHVFAQQCTVFNAALQRLAYPSLERPLANRHYSWEAQKTVLSASTLGGPISAPNNTGSGASGSSSSSGSSGSSTPPSSLTINKASFTAMRSVLVSLRKSGAERATAARYGRSWPPYRVDLDGMEEVGGDDAAARQFSRAVRSGLIARESGYANDGLGPALDAIAGTSPDLTPTIHTRSLPPRRSGSAYYALWAAKVRATRNATEAWAQFRSPPPRAEAAATDDGGDMHGDGQSRTATPDAQVYHEMFQKLLAPEHHHDGGESDGPAFHRGLQTSSDPAAVLPGETLRTFATDDASLSAFERARLEPPSVGRLYDQMLYGHAVRPAGNLLAALLRGASPSLAAAVGFLVDSDLDRRAVDELICAVDLGSERRPVQQAGAGNYHHQENNHGTITPHRKTQLGLIPLSVFGAYVDMLCRTCLRGRRSWPVDGHGFFEEPSSSSSSLSHSVLTQTLALIEARRLASRDGLQYRPPWHSVLAALAWRPRRRLRADTQHGDVHGDESDGRRSLDDDTEAHDARARVAPFLHVFARAKDRLAGAVDATMLLHLCTLLRNAMDATLRAAAGVEALAERRQEHRQERPPSAASRPLLFDEAALQLIVPAADVALLRRAHALLRETFDSLVPPPRRGSTTTEEEEASSSAAPAEGTRRPGHHLAHATREVHPAVLHAYVLALAHVGDAEGMREGLDAWLSRGGYAVASATEKPHNPAESGSVDGQRLAPPQQTTPPAAAAVDEHNRRAGNWHAMVLKAACAVRAYAPLDTPPSSYPTTTHQDSTAPEANPQQGQPWWCPTEAVVASYVARPPPPGAGRTDEGDAYLVRKALWERARGRAGTWDRDVVAAMADSRGEEGWGGYDGGGEDGAGDRGAELKRGARDDGAQERDLRKMLNI